MRLLTSLRRLLDGFWLVPGSIASLLALLALLLLELDRRWGVTSVSFAFGGDADAARNVLSTIAGSLITVAGLTFSITIVVLTLISSQYTPRAIQSFLADRFTQVVAGAFVGIFAYCLIVLGAVRSTEAASSFVPVVSVSVALGLGLLALALLVAFIHHMAQNIQASNIVARLGEQTLQALDRLYPERFDPVADIEARGVVERWREHGEPSLVTARSVGYVQHIHWGQLVDCVETRPVYVHVAVAPGTFVTPDLPIVEVWPRGAVDDGAAACIRGQFTIGEERDVRQDAAYGFRQLSDVAVKALSPSVNDPTTAVAALGRASAALECLAARRFPPAVRAYEAGGVFLAATRDDFEDFLETALGEVAHYAADNPRVVTAVLEALARVADVALRVGAHDRLAAIERLADDVVDHARSASTSDRDRARIDEAMLRFVGARK